MTEPYCALDVRPQSWINPSVDWHRSCLGRAANPVRAGAARLPIRGWGSIPGEKVAAPPHPVSPLVASLALPLNGAPVLPGGTLKLGIR